MRKSGLDQANDTHEMHAEENESVCSHSGGAADESGLGDNERKRNAEMIAERESLIVWWLRAVVCVVLLASMVTVAIIVFNHMRDAEEEDFKNQFESDAAKILDGVATSFDNTLGAADSMATRMVSHAHYANITWPYFVLPDFYVQASKLTKTSKALWMATSMVVSAEERLQWENFSINNDQWLKETLELEMNDPDLRGRRPQTTDFLPIPFIWDYDGPVNGTRPYSQNTYLPTWQEAPMLTDINIYNYDAWADPIIAQDITRIFKVRKPMIASGFHSVVEFPDDPEHVEFVDFIAEYFSQFIGPEEEAYEPSTAIMYPVIDMIDSVRLPSENLPAPVALVVQIAYWRDLIRDILPPNSKGLILVVEDTCRGSAVTYQIDGPETTFLGMTDLHDPDYNDRGVSQSIVDLMDSNNLNRDSTYTGLPLDDECQKILHVYPSQTMEDLFITAEPRRFSVVALLIFVFTSIVFLAYDLAVSRRQDIVLRKAQASGAIVSSLFPENVRNQLYQESKEKQEKADGLKNFMTSSDRSNGPSRNSRPIADVFDDTTVFFADLAGFTQWSDKRTPTEVFELLEALYGEFDKIAVRRKVFKVETIGDCYVAVTGIPDPQPDHSIIMVKFARDCIMKMREVTLELAQTLGSDTADLGMRVGLHSGSCTAGVLRGDKGRFQLFGDTVNTASRMESNGVRGKIHVSQATADCLRALGKSHWITAREDRISAKGKGLLQTYFVSVSPKEGVNSLSRHGSISGGPLQSGKDNSDEMDDQEHERLAEQLSRYQSRVGFGKTTDNGEFSL